MFFATFQPDAVAESVERSPHMREIGRSVPSRVKAITYQIDNCHIRSTLLEYGKDWFAQCQDNVTEWDTRS